MNEQYLSEATMKAAANNAKFNAHPRYQEYLAAVREAHAAGANHPCERDNPYNVTVKKIAAAIKSDIP